MNKLLLPALALVLAGCATPVPDKTHVLFSRYPGFAGKKCLTEIKVNGKSMGKVQMEEVMVIRVQPGEHLVEGSSGSGGCANFRASDTIRVKQTSVATIIVETK